ncbi:MAG TPA: DUF1653 domain-containing protein [Candidatus Saccharimonadales bacterium]|nr:DUF1653 domain-containing protein [Candidatus Saccharimonadales bacterium]
MSKDILAGVYRHYTGLMVLVLGVARHSETEESFMVYVPLGPKKGPRLTVRPLEMFQGMITVNGKKVPRFTYIAPEMPEELSQGYYQMHGWGYPGKE